LQPCLLKIYSHMVTFWGNYEGISQCGASLHMLLRHQDPVVQSVQGAEFYNIPVHEPQLRAVHKVKIVALWNHQCGS
ncbi:hypothetical protein, partial [Escherichia coli]